MSYRKNTRLLTEKVIGKALNLSEEWVEGTKTFHSDQIFNIAILASLEKSSIDDISESLREEYYDNLQEKGFSNNKSKPPSPDTVFENFKDSIEEMTAKDLGN